MPLSLFSLNTPLYLSTNFDEIFVSCPKILPSLNEVRRDSKLQDKQESYSKNELSPNLFSTMFFFSIEIDPIPFN